MKISILAAAMFRSEPAVRFLVPDQELGTIMEKSANVMKDEEVDGDDTNSHDNPRRQESKRHHRNRKTKSIRGRDKLQRAESIRKEEVSGKK